MVLSYILHHDNHPPHDSGGLNYLLVFTLRFTPLFMREAVAPMFIPPVLRVHRHFLHLPPGGGVLPIQTQFSALGRTGMCRLYGWVFSRRKICRYGYILGSVPKGLTQFIKNRLRTTNYHRESRDLDRFFLIS